MTNQEFNGIGCASVADIEIPEAASAYFKLDEGVHKIRVLQGPVLGYISQEWDDGKPVGDKIMYKYDDPKAQEDPNSRLQMTFLVFDYKTKAVVVWEIAQKTILEAIKNINGIQPDLSAFDIQVTRSAKGGRTSYNVAQGPNSPFTDKKAIKEVTEKNILARLEELKKDDSNGSLADEEKAIEAEIAAKNAAPVKKAAEVKTEPELTSEEGAAAFK